MKKIICALPLLLVLVSCVRRELTYSYTPTVEVVIEADWSNMTATPTGMSIYCYNISDESVAPVIKQTNTVNSTTVSLAAGEYRIIVFNLTPAEYGGIDFAGLDNYETAEVLAVSTRSSWYESKADEEEFLASEPEELAIATDHTLEIPLEVIDEVLGLRDNSLYNQEVILPYDTIRVTPQVVVHRTRVTVEVDGIHNFSAARATLTGMATGYDISEQTSHADYATHLLEAWVSTTYDYDITQGNMTVYFDSFGLPETSTSTRTVDESWAGTMHLETLLVDNKTIEEFDFDLNDKIATIGDDEDEDITNRSEEEARADDEEYEEDTSTDVDIDIDISLAVDISISLPDVEPAGSSSTGGFNPEVNDWEEEENVQVPA